MPRKVIVPKNRSAVPEQEEAGEDTEDSEAEDNEKEIDLTPGALSRTDDPEALPQGNGERCTAQPRRRD